MDIEAKASQLHRLAQSNIIEMVGDRAARHLGEVVTGDFNPNGIYTPLERALWDITLDVEERLQIITWLACAAPLERQVVAQHIGKSFFKTCQKMESQNRAQGRKLPCANVVAAICSLALPETDELQLLYDRPRKLHVRFEKPVLLWPTDEMAFFYIGDSIKRSYTDLPEKMVIEAKLTEYFFKRGLACSLNPVSEQDDKTGRMITIRRALHDQIEQEKNSRDNVVGLFPKASGLEAH